MKNTVVSILMLAGVYAIMLLYALALAMQALNVNNLYSCLQ